MISYRDFVAAFRSLGMGNQSRVIAHASLSAFGQVLGGAQTLIGALLASCETVCMPSFTYRTMVIPPVGPPDNAIDYNLGLAMNPMAEIFSKKMPVDPALGVVAEALRTHTLSRRSHHPILSFCGVNAEPALEVQSLEEPLAPIGWLAEQDGDVLLIGVDHTANTSLHYAEMIAGRKQFTRWALTRHGIVTCPGFPGCSAGFQAIATRFHGVARQTVLGNAVIESIPLRDLINITTGWLHADPLAMLCKQKDCARCQAIRQTYRKPS